jgi:beta-phosphoglucomutase-like phosphatase (HAD superfamily)
MPAMTPYVIFDMDGLLSTSSEIRRRWLIYHSVRIRYRQSPFSS